MMHKSIKSLTINLTRNLSRSDITVENCLGNSINSFKELQNSVTSIPSFLVSTQHLLHPKPDYKDVIQDDQESEGSSSRKSLKSVGSGSRKSSSITSTSNMGYAKPWLLERDSSIGSYSSSRRSSNCPSIITAEQFEVDSSFSHYHLHYNQHQPHNVNELEMVSSCVYFSFLQNNAFVCKGIKSGQVQKMYVNLFFYSSYFESIFFFCILVNVIPELELFKNY